MSQVEEETITRSNVIALKKLVERAQEIGVVSLVNCILVCLMRPNLKDQESQFLIRTLANVLSKADYSEARPFAAKIILSVQPFLVENSHSCRKTREVICILCEIIGFESIIEVIEPHMNDDSEFVRDMAAKTIGIVASALGIQTVLPFVKGACENKLSWRVRHTGIRIVEQIALQVGCSLLPHLKALVDIIEHGLSNKDQEVIRITALSLSALATAVTPHGYEAFESLLPVLFAKSGGPGFHFCRGRNLAALIKLSCSIMAHIDLYIYRTNENICPYTVGYYAFSTVTRAQELLEEPDEEMTGIALEAVKCLQQMKRPYELPGVFLCGPDQELVVFASFRIALLHKMWGGKIALNRKNYKMIVDLTVKMAEGFSPESLKKVIDTELCNYSKKYREIVVEIIRKASACNIANVSEDDEQFEDVFRSMAYLFHSSF